MMRLGDTEAYTLEGVVFHVRPDWDFREKHGDRCYALARPTPEMTEEERDKVLYEAGNGRVKSALQMLKDTIASIEGLEDEKGAPVTAWSDKLRVRFSEPLVAELMARITLYRSDDRLGESTTPPEASEQ